MEIPPPDPSEPPAATPTTASLQLDAEADGELYGEDAAGAGPQPAAAAPAAAVGEPLLPPAEAQSGAVPGIPGLFLISDPPRAGEEMALDGEPSAAQLLGEQADGELAARELAFAVEAHPQTAGPSIGTQDSADGGGVPTQAENGALDTDMADRFPGMIEKAHPEKDPLDPLDPLDPDFIAAGEANKDDVEAEWQLDSSSSSSSSAADSSSDEAGSDDDYPMMNHEQLAKLLMREDGGDDDAAHKEGFQGPLKTKNEIPEEAVPIPRPAVVLTPATPLEALGAIESIVGTMVLIKAFVSGDHQVLNEGSLLVFEDRTILGVVADTFGRVEEPLYTVRFNTPEEIAETGATTGQKVFYVPEHSDYVFTQALKGIKGSDASNIFDEEVGEAEREFSDDEQEAEYKRQRKHARQGQTGSVRGGRGRGARNQTPTVGGSDELYTPLARPANLAELMSGPPPLPPMNGGGGSRGDRGHHRGGRNDRGRGRGRGGQRAGRGNDFRKRDRDGEQGREYQDRDGHISPSYQPRPQPYNQQPDSHPSHPQGGYQQQYQQPQQYQPQYQPYQSQQWTPPANQPQFPQFPGYPQQSQYSQYQPQQNFYQQAGTPGRQFPPALPQGSHVNPAFFRGQQQPQSMPAPPGRSDFQWSAPAPQGQQQFGQQGQGQQEQRQQSTEAAFKALQNLVSMSNQMRNGPPNPPPAPQ